MIVVVVLLVYQQIENHVLLPVVYGRTVDLSPLAVLIALLIGAEIAGVLGALAAIPVAGSISVIASELVRWRREASLHLSPLRSKTVSIRTRSSRASRRAIM